MEVLIRDIIKKGRDILRDAGIEDAENDSRFIAEYLFKIRYEDVYINPGMSVRDEMQKQYFAFIDKRAGHVPLQYLTGHQEFMGMDFKVNDDVLIPRQDTEILTEAAVKYINGISGDVRVLDMCTGSGCIAISVDRLCADAHVDGVDISQKALDVAKINNKNNTADVNFFKSDMFENVRDVYDVIVSNPPYIKRKEIDFLMAEVKDHEPVLALDGDEDGLKFYRCIGEKGMAHLASGGRLMLEIGYDQGESVPNILREQGFAGIEILKDLSGMDRVVIAGKE